MSLKNITIFLVVLLTCLIAVFAIYKNPKTPQEYFGEDVLNILTNVSHMDAYRASKKYKQIKTESESPSLPKIIMDSADAEHIIELLKNDNSYRWGIYKRAVFIPTIGYKIYSKEGQKLDVVFSFKAKQLRFSLNGSFFTIDCEPIAPEMKKIADRILAEEVQSQNIEFE